MKPEGGVTWTFGDLELPVHSLNTLVVGSGAAARNAALQLIRRGVTDIAIATDSWNAGTSYNAGSDKQTYYKLALTGGPDSAEELARDLWAGGSMHGDIALCEAQGSAQAFFNLVDLGVPFPHDRHGGYLGYQTDNDERRRATSAGPLTSKLMCEQLGLAGGGPGLRPAPGGVLAHPGGEGRGDRRTRSLNRLRGRRHRQESSGGRELRPCLLQRPECDPRHRWSRGDVP